MAVNQFTVIDVLSANYSPSRSREFYQSGGAERASAGAYVEGRDGASDLVDDIDSGLGEFDRVHQRQEALLDVLASNLELLGDTLETRRLRECRVEWSSERKIGAMRSDARRRRVPWPNRWRGTYESSARWPCPVGRDIRTDAWPWRDAVVSRRRHDSARGASRRTWAS